MECKGETIYVKRSHDSEIKEAIREQQQIGIHLRLWGFLGKGWMRAIEKAGASHPEQRINTLLLRMVWDTIMNPLWQERNKIKHNKDNAYNAAEDERLSGRTVCYVDHRYELVNYHDQFLAEIDLTRLGGMRGQTKRK